jgi:hypothetical protein
MDEEKRRGRPRTRDEATARRTYLGFAVPVPLKSNLEEAAKANRRSLAAEATSRLETSFHPALSREDHLLALLLGAIYQRNGLGGLVRFLITNIDSPDEEEQWLRRSIVESELLSLHPDSPKSCFIASPDDEAQQPEAPVKRRA